MRLMAWVRRLLRPIPAEPPELQALYLPSSEDRRSLLDEAHSSIRHRETILRSMEARANVRGGVTRGDDDVDNH